MRPECLTFQSPVGAAQPIVEGEGPLGDPGLDVRLVEVLRKPRVREDEAEHVLTDARVADPAAEALVITLGARVGCRRVERRVQPDGAFPDFPGGSHVTQDRGRPLVTVDDDGHIPKAKPVSPAKDPPGITR
jgi:hypothetical protein